MRYKERDYPVSIESAEEQFEMLLDAYDVDMIGLKDMGESGQKAYELIDAQYSNFVLNIRRGFLSVVSDENGVCIKQHLRNKIETNRGPVTEITYYPLTQAHVIAADKYDRRNEPTMRQSAFLGAVSKLGIEVFNKMAKGADSRAVNSVYSFFTLEE